MIAAALGNRLTSEVEDAAETGGLAPGGLTIAELAAAASKPVAGGDTTPASMSILEQLMAQARVGA